MKAILGKKVGMTQVFEENGRMIPVTVIEAGPCYVTQLKTLKNDGYEAVQIGFGEVKNLNKPKTGHLKKLKDLKLGTLKEIRTEPKEEIEAEIELSEEETGVKPVAYNLGDMIKADVFAKGDIVQVMGNSKGKGFAGVIKRHNFHRGPMTHGSHHHRKPGSIGAMYPQHVMKGKKLPGRMGNIRVTTKNLKIVRVDAEKNLIAIRGAVPGPKKGIILISCK